MSDKTVLAKPEPNTYHLAISHCKCNCIIYIIQLKYYRVPILICGHFLVELCSSVDSQNWQQSATRE